MSTESSVSAKATSSNTAGQLSNAPVAIADQPAAVPDTLPILPIHNLVLFPGTVLPLTVVRETSCKLLEESLPQSKVIGVFTQKNPELDNPGVDDFHHVGVAASVLKLIRQPDGSIIII